MDKQQREALKSDVVKADRGPFIGWWATMLEHRPDTLRRIHEHLIVAENGKFVSEKMRHLLWVAVDSVVTHLFPRGIGVHADVAMRLGATQAQVTEALEIASFVSSRGFGFALPLLMSELERQGKGVPARAPTAEEASAKQEFVRRGVCWAPWMDQAMLVCPDYLNGLLNFAFPATPAPDGLDEKSRALIFLACSACPAIADAEATRLHLARAVSLGIDPGEIVQVLQLANSIGVHPLSTGITAVEELFSRAQK